jgi:urease gamma subunit
MWPASERSCVICVNSSDADGNPSSFNPTQPMPKFCTLGEGLELRLTKDQMATAAKKMKDATQVARDRVESGTSFAAPIATALVATILSFVDGNVESAELNERQKHRLKKLRTQHGMLQVLKERCVESSLATRNDYYYIAPWFFSLDPANIHGILDALGRA